MSLYAKHQLQDIKHMNTNTMEATSAFDNEKQIYITCIYRYPNSSIPNFIHDRTSISAVTTKHPKVIMGDFNINHQNKNSHTVERICKALGTKQPINKPTTKHNTTIDPIHTNLTSDHLANVMKTYYSDHDQIYITIK